VYGRGILETYLTDAVLYNAMALKWQRAPISINQPDALDVLENHAGGQHAQGTVTTAL
jgi:hypothetical protein